MNCDAYVVYNVATVNSIATAVDSRSNVDGTPHIQAAGEHYEIVSP